MGTSTEGIALMRVSEPAAAAATPREQDAIAIGRVAMAGLEAKINALKYANAMSNSTVRRRMGTLGGRRRKLPRAS